MHPRCIAHSPDCRLQTPLRPSCLLSPLPLPNPFSHTLCPAGVYIAYALVAYCYFGVSYTGYYALGNSAGDQILYALSGPIWVVCMANIMVVIHVCGSFQVYAMPVSD